MNYLKIAAFWCLTLSGICSILPVYAQQTYKLGQDPLLQVSGESSLKDWKMEASDAQGSGVFQVSDGKLQDISSLKVTLKAEELKSGTRGLDNNAYDALNTSEYPDITFELLDFSGGERSGEAKGKLTIAGVSREISFPVQIRKQGEGYNFTGEVSTKLTEFSIDPPTALLGSVRTRDEITLSFDTQFVPSN
ncbi:YceI family protein [Pleomorphovibrio marinus]|uniref:YceI family protein n=1 Tax=Pleomorphovibrio marinus TaxID=2164132 RepID=UPI000E0BB12F|nr:YceI family protein [Pleomorphovibrio marinus]